MWGIGRRISAQLIEGGVTTVLDLVRADAATIRGKFSVVVERTVRELQGTSCVDLESVPQPKQEIACTRSFGHPITELHELEEAVTEFASRAAQNCANNTALLDKCCASSESVRSGQTPNTAGPSRCHCVGLVGTHRRLWVRRLLVCELSTGPTTRWQRLASCC